MSQFLVDVARRDCLPAELQGQMANVHNGSSETRRAHSLSGRLEPRPLLAPIHCTPPLNAEGKMDGAEVRHSTLKVGRVIVFYRDAELDGRPVLLLLHGFANSSHYFRHLMPLLANCFHLIAPDLPSLGLTKVDGDSYRYTVAQLTETTQAFVDALGLRSFAVYIFVPDISRIEPEAYWLDAALLAQPGMMGLQIDLKLDCKDNLDRYLLYQQYLRMHLPPLLAIWGGMSTSSFRPARKHSSETRPNAVIKFLYTGHFALETNLEDICISNSENADVTLAPR